MKELKDCRAYFQDAFLNMIEAGGADKGIYENTEKARYGMLSETLGFIYGDAFRDAEARWRQEALNEYYAKEKNAGEGSKSMDDGRTYTVTEVCPHCGNEIEMTWDTDTDGFRAFCPHCGKRLMLCDECRHAGCGPCDYDSATDTCRHNKEQAAGQALGGRAGASAKDFAAGQEAYYIDPYTNAWGHGTVIETSSRYVDLCDPDAGYSLPEIAMDREDVFATEEECLNELKKRLDATYQLCLIEKPEGEGLSASELAELASHIEGDEMLPAEFEAKEHESSAMGFISSEYAESIGYDYDALGRKIAEILDDMSLESPDGTYNICGAKVRLTR